MLIVQAFPAIFFRYWYWYYIVQPKALLRAWWNFLVFGNSFFSIPLLLKTLFAPFHLYFVSYGRGFDLKVWLEAFFSNLIFRTIGAMVRIVVILLGILFEIFVFIAGAVIFLSWLVLPLALFFLLIFALKFFFV